eukprot:CFRG0279T1
MPLVASEMRDSVGSSVANNSGTTSSVADVNGCDESVPSVAHGEVGVQVPIANIVAPALSHNPDGTVRFSTHDTLKSGKLLSKPVVTIKTNRNVYFDNDEISGCINIQSDIDRVFPNTMALLLCRYAAKNPSLPPREKVCTLHCTKYAVAGSLFVPVGVTKIPFSFITPENVPPSFESRWGDVLWEIRLVHQGSASPLVTLGKLKFRKASLYYSLPGYLPTSQAERFLYFTGKTLRIEASLSNDVVSIGDAIDVKVGMYYNTTSGKPIPVKKIKGSVIQNLFARKKSIVIMSKEITLENTTMEPKTWAADLVTTGEGVSAEKKFSLKPQNVPKACVQRVKNAQGRVVNTMIAPSAIHDGERSTVWLKYVVVLKFVLNGAPDIVLRLPFHQQNTRDEAVACGIEDIHERMVFPESEEPPVYSTHRRLSVPTYKAFRKNSIDSAGCISATGGDVMEFENENENDPDLLEPTGDVSSVASTRSITMGGSVGPSMLQGDNRFEYRVDSPTPKGRRQRSSSVVLGLIELSGLGRSLPESMDSGSTSSLPRHTPVHKSRSSTLVGMLRRRGSSIGQAARSQSNLASAEEEGIEYRSPYFPHGRKEVEANANRVGTGLAVGSSHLRVRPTYGSDIPDNYGEETTSSRDLQLPTNSQQGDLSDEDECRDER